MSVPRMTSNPYDDLLVGRKQLLESLERVLKSENIQENLTDVIEKIRCLEPRVQSIPASNLSLEDVQELLGLRFNLDDFRDVLFGYTEESKERVWSDGENTDPVPISAWLAEAIDKVVEYVHLQSNESAARSLVTVVLLDTLEELQQLQGRRSTTGVTRAPSSPTRTESSRSPVVHTPTPSTVHQGKYHAPTVSASPPKDQPSNPSNTLLANLALPQTPQTTPPQHSPKPLQLRFKESLSLLIPAQPNTNQKPIKINGVADYTIGYSVGSELRRFTKEEEVALRQASSLIAIEAKKAGDIMSAIPQCLVYMGIIRCSGIAVDKRNTTVFGICSSGNDFIILRSDNFGTVTRSPTLQLHRKEHKYKLISYLRGILHAARASSPQTNSWKTLSQRERNFELFNVPSQGKFVDFGVEDWDVVSSDSDDLKTRVVDMAMGIV